MMAVTAVHLWFCSSGFVVASVLAGTAMQWGTWPQLVCGLSCALMLAVLYVKLQGQLP
jgi:hypothetical protein